MARERRQQLLAGFGGGLAQCRRIWRRGGHPWRSVGHYGTANGGFADTALPWYLQNYPMEGKPYTIVTGYITGLTPSFIAGELRRTEWVSIGIYPAKDLQIEGHAISVWGDDGPIPGSAAVTDSHRGSAGAATVEIYDWAPPANPGEPWRLMYGGTTVWYLGYLATLCDVPEPGTVVMVFLGAGGPLFIHRPRRVYRG